ncbi:MAG: amphi-Trp domain-containing protein [Planctomycetes bacterium]|nr:amphi-Trp domain-containing protein [Planctomycetota bacterium]
MSSKSKKKSGDKPKKEKSKKATGKVSGNGKHDVDNEVEHVEVQAAEKAVKTKASVAFEAPIQREEAVSYFETLVAGLKKGSIHLRQNDEELTLTPPAQLEVKVKASRKKDKEKLSFEIVWRTPNASELLISSE